MIEVGDIVRHGGKLWAVRELERSVPLGFPPDGILDDGNGTVLRVSTDALEVVLSPELSPGMDVAIFNGAYHAVIVRDDGDTVLCTDDRIKPPFGRQMYVTPIGKGVVVAENLSLILKQLEL
jgi:hypothetical protein